MRESRAASGRWMQMRWVGFASFARGDALEDRFDWSHRHLRVRDPRRTRARDFLAGLRGPGPGATVRRETKPQSAHALPARCTLRSRVHRQARAASLCRPRPTLSVSPNLLGVSTGAQVWRDGRTTERRARCRARLSGCRVIVCTIETSSATQLGRDAVIGRAAVAPPPNVKFRAFTPKPRSGMKAFPTPAKSRRLSVSR